MFKSFRMRLFASVIAGIIYIPGFAYGQRPMPIENGVLQSDLNAATFSVNNATNVTASGNFIGNLTGNANTANTSTNASYSTAAGNASFANTSTNATYAVTAGNLTSFPANLVYTDVASNNFTLSGTQGLNKYSAGLFQYYANDGVQIGANSFSSGINVFPASINLFSSSILLNGPVSSSTGNLSLSGTNLTFDTGDIFLNGGDVNQVGNVTAGALGGGIGTLTLTSPNGNNTSVNIRSTGTLGSQHIQLNLQSNTTTQGGLRANTFGTLWVEGTNSLVAQGNSSATLTAPGSGGIIVDKFVSGQPSGISLNDTLLLKKIETATNLTFSSSETFNYIEATVANITISPTFDHTEGTTYFIKNSSNGTITFAPAGYLVDGQSSLTLPPQGSMMVTEDRPSYNWTSAFSGHYLPANVTLSSTAFSGNATWAGTNSFNGTTTIQSKFNIKQGVNHDVDVISNGTSTTQMSFVKITATGNFTVHDGANGDWITFKNASGGTVTLLSATTETFDGNASLSLNNLEAVDLTNDGSNWNIH